jgi:hypothetical protein
MAWPAAALARPPVMDPDDDGTRSSVRPADAIRVIRMLRKDGGERGSGSLTLAVKKPATITQNPYQ